MAGGPGMMDMDSDLNKQGHSSDLFFVHRGSAARF
jgi:hypothetical protein